MLQHLDHLDRREAGRAKRQRANIRQYRRRSLEIDGQPARWQGSPPRPPATADIEAGAGERERVELGIEETTAVGRGAGGAARAWGGGVAPSAVAGRAARPWLTDFRNGLLTNVLNPKVAIFFLAALPQFVGTGPDAPWQGMLLIAIVYGLGFLWCALLALLATKAGRKVGQSSAMRWFEGAMGVGFFGLAGRLALARNI